MSTSGMYKHVLDPEAPGLDEETRRRRRVLAKMQQMSGEELFQGLVRAGIYTPDGELTTRYRDDEPSAYRNDEPGEASRSALQRRTSTGKYKHVLDPDAPGLDDDTRRRRRALARMQQASIDELFQFAVRAGIYTSDGELTAPYRGDAPSAYRDEDPSD